jgi:hypothetical protein
MNITAPNDNPPIVDLNQDEKVYLKKSFSKPARSPPEKSFLKKIKQIKIIKAAIRQATRKSANLNNRVLVISPGVVPGFIFLKINSEMKMKTSIWMNTKRNPLAK